MSWFCVYCSRSTKVYCYAVNTKIVMTIMSITVLICSTDILGRLYTTKEKQLISAILQNIQIWYKVVGAVEQKDPHVNSNDTNTYPMTIFFNYVILIRRVMSFKEKYKEILLLLEYLERNFVLMMQAKLSLIFRNV